MHQISIWIRLPDKPTSRGVCLDAICPGKLRKPVLRQISYPFNWQEMFRTPPESSSSDSVKNSHLADGDKQPDAKPSLHLAKNGRTIFQTKNT